MILLNLGGIIPGDSKVTEHEDWITVNSIQFGVGRSISESGSGSDRDTSTPSFSEITFSKSTDKTSAEFFSQAACGKKICDKAEIHWMQTSGDATQVYLKVSLYDPIVSSYSISSGGERPSESFSINFTKIAMQYTQFDGDQATDIDPKGYDLMANQEANEI